VAAQGAAKAKLLAQQLSSSSSSSSTGKAADVLEQSRLAAVQVEKDFLKKELDELRTETTELKALLNASLQTSVSKKTVASVASPTTVAAPQRKRLPMDPEENERILNLLKEMDQNKSIQDVKDAKVAAETAAQEAAQAATDAKVAAQKVAAAKRAKEQADAAAAKIKADAAAVAQKEVDAAKATIAKTKADAKAFVQAESQKLVNAEASLNTAPPQKAAPKKKKTVAKKASPPKVSVKPAAPAPVVTVTAPAAPTPTPAVTVKKHTTNIEVVGNAESLEKKPEPSSDSDSSSSSSSSSNPWSILSDSTLKRKTVKDLTAYLTERGAKATDESGKPLKKAILVEGIKAL